MQRAIIASRLSTRWRLSSRQPRRESRWIASDPDSCESASALPSISARTPLEVASIGEAGREEAPAAAGLRRAQRHAVGCPRQARDVCEYLGLPDPNYSPEH